jgi:hypothetical protein
MPDQSANLNPMSGPGDSRPVPDPTLLTTEGIRREVGMLRELLETRLDGMDRAMALFQENITRVPTDVDKQVGHLKALHEEKFLSIEVQFRERDVRTEQTSRDSKVAVDAALQAAKEAVGEQNRSSALAIAKSETATVKQIDQQGLLIATATSGLNDKIDDLKARLTLMEGRGSGMLASWAVAVAVFGMLLGVGGLILALTR